MASTDTNHLRILAVSPSFWGFGFVVLEGKSTLVDWDAKVTFRDKTSWCMKEIERLIRQYAPDVLTLYDHLADSKRSPRIRRLNKRLVALAKRHKIKVQMFSPAKVAKILFPEKAVTKYEIATTLAARFADELSFRLPPKRKAWMNQDRRMDIFDAVALALAFRLRGNSDNPLRK